MRETDLGAIVFWLPADTGALLVVWVVVVVVEVVVAVSAAAEFKWSCWRRRLWLSLVHGCIAAFVAQSGFVTARNALGSRKPRFVNPFRELSAGHRSGIQRNPA